MAPAFLVMQVNTKDFEKALQFALEHTSREVPKVINSAAIEVITIAARLTKKAEKSQIENALRNAVLYTVKQRNDAKILKRLTSGADEVPIVYLILNKNQRSAGLPGLNNSQMSVAAKKFIQNRIKSIGFVAYGGWQKALKAFGGRGFGSKSKLSGIENTTAKDGYGIKATAGKMFAKMVNTAAACEEYGYLPLQEAVDLKAKDMRRHVEEKLSKICQQASRR
jgi:hypothetical protein